MEFVVICFDFYFLFVFDKVSLCSSDSPGTHYDVTQLAASAVPLLLAQPPENWNHESVPLLAQSPVLLEAAPEHHIASGFVYGKPQASLCT